MPNKILVALLLTEAPTK